MILVFHILIYLFLFQARRSLFTDQQAIKKCNPSCQRRFAAAEARHRASLSYYKRKLANCVAKKPKITISDVIQFCSDKISQSALNLLQHQLKKHKKVRWNKQAKQTCLSLHFTGPRLYKFLRSIYTLPSVSTLNRFVAHVTLKPGINPGIMKNLKYKVQSMLPVDRKCILLIDEMSIKSGLTYKRKFQSISGFVDLGNKSQSPIQANSALVFMLAGLRKKWKQPLAFFFSRDSFSATDLDGILRDCVIKLFECGLEVLGITSDQGSNFMKYFRLQNVTPKSPSFEIDGKQILVFPDVPHLLKSTRNILYSGHTITTDEGIVSFAPIISTVIRNQNEVLNLLPKITDQHIHLPKFGGKMKVKLASQILSHSMSAAMKTLIANKLLPPHAVPTQVFCAKMNRLFDILNSVTFTSKTPYRQGLKLNSSSWMALEELYDWVKQWRVCNQEGVDITKRFKCINGWSQVIKAVWILGKKILNESDFKCLFTQRLCQDPLENTFGVIRLAGGLRDRPDSSQFIDSFRKVYFENILKAPVSSNCSPDQNDTLFDVFDFTYVQDDEEYDSNFFDDPEELAKPGSVISKNASRYLAGYAARVIRDIHPNCSICLNQCSTTNANAEDLMFTNFKNYYPQITEGKGLVACSISFVEHLRACEHVFQQLFETSYHKRRIGFYLEEELMKIDVHKFCSDRIKKLFTKKYVNQRIFISIKRLNRVTAIAKKARRSLKMKKTKTVTKACRPQKTITKPMKKLSANMARSLKTIKKLKRMTHK